jgi:hypothetical protein
MLLDVLDDVFLLDFSFEAAKRALNGFAFLNSTSATDGITPSPDSPVGACMP